MARRGKEHSGSHVEYGNVAALWEIVERTGLVEIIDKAAPKRNGESVGKLVALMAINRCVDPLAKLEIPEWYEKTYLPELMGVKLPAKSGYQTLTRCYDYLTDAVQQDIELELAGRVMEQFHIKHEVFIYDVTSTFVEGEGSAEILKRGYSRDRHPECKQVNYALCVTAEEGVPVFHEAFPGNRVDSKTVKDTMVRFRDRHKLDGCLVVDRGIVTHKNVEEIVDVRKLELVGGMRMDQALAKRVRGVALESYGEPFTVGDEVLRAVELPVVIRKKERRCILYYSGEKAERDRKAREKNLAEVKKELGKLAASLSRKKGRKPKPKNVAKKVERLLEHKDCKRLVSWKFVGGRGGRRLKWDLDEAAIRERELLDGKYVLITTLKRSPQKTLETYRGRDKVERGFRITKQVIRIRPMFNRKEEHIKAHLFICFLAYLLMSLLQLEVRRSGHDLTAVKALKKLARLTRRVERDIEVDDEEELLEHIFTRHRPRARPRHR